MSRSTRSTKPARSSRSPEARKARRIVRQYLAACLAATCPALTKEERATAAERATSLEARVR